ncbi:MAG: Sensor histidine kinase RcsC [bacterium]|nr:Sensor histidine kinase RcsC [bacterium]
MMAEPTQTQTILVVEDDAATIELERRAFQRVGRALRTATRVEDAIRMLRSESFSAVVLDYRLPDGEAWPVLAEANAVKPVVPVIMVTALGDEKVAARAIHEGAADYVIKTGTFWEDLPLAVERVVTLASAERALRESEERFRQLAENIREVFWLMDIEDGQIIYVNPSFEHVWGLPIEILHQEPLAWPMNVHPEDQPSVAGAFGPSVPSNGYQLEYRILHPSGSVRWIRDRGFPVKNDLGETYRLVGLAEDITERKEMDLRLKRLAAAMEHVADAVMITESDGAIRYVNPAFERTTGYSAFEVLGLNPRFLKSGEHPPEHYRSLWETILSGNSWSGRMVNRRKDGSTYTEEATISPVFDTEGRLMNFVAVKRDVTDELLLEARIRHLEKMEAVGQLAGGIAHDFNNMLQIILAYGQFLQREVAPGSNGARDLDKILDSAKRAAELTHQLLAFSRKTELVMFPLDLQPVVKEVARMIERTFPTSISVNYRIEEGLPPVVADLGRIHQLLVNLCVNARDAMPHGGRLEISVSTQDITPTYCKENPGALPGLHVVIGVADTGMGIGPDALPHIFEPFFTTKEAGKGTGLGLATVYGIVKQHGGFITCYSEVSKGTLFRAYLPAKVGRETQAEPPPEERDLPRGTETVLVVDDQEAILEICRRRLVSLGYTVLTARDGREALGVFESNRSDIAAVLLDIQMPEMDGLDCCERILEQSPDMRVLLSSGFIDSEIRSRIAALGSVGFVHKPFETDALARTIRTSLDSPPRGGGR